jgi:hypothetical protein
LFHSSLFFLPVHRKQKDCRFQNTYEDPEHKDEIIGFYLDAVFTGINLVNARITPPLFCMEQQSPESAFAAIDKRIMKLKKEKSLSPDKTVDSIMMDILIEEYPCK